jgi:XapX domain-containing protein
MRYSKILIGLLVSFGVGVGCRLLLIPVPSPPVLSGALLVLMMSLGYWLVDRFVSKSQAVNKRHCGGHVPGASP